MINVESMSPQVIFFSLSTLDQSIRYEFELEFEISAGPQTIYRYCHISGSQPALVLHIATYSEVVVQQGLSLFMYTV